MKKYLYLILLFYTSIYADSLDVNTNYETIGFYTSYFEDKSASLDIDQIKKVKFTPLNAKIATELVTKSAFWYKLSVSNKSKSDQERVISFGAAWLDHINIYIFDQENNLSTFVGGDDFSFEHRSIRVTKINYRHSFTNGNSEVYIRVKTRDPFLVSISFENIDSFYLNNTMRVLEMSIIFGIIIAMLLYNFFLFVSSKDYLYIHYVLYLITFLLLLSSYNGLMYEYFWPNFAVFENYAPSLFMSIYAAAGMVFANSFLQLKKQHLKIYKLYKIFFVYILVTPFLAYLYGGYHILILMAIINATFYSVFIVSISIVSFIHGNPSAKFYMYGSITGLMGTIITAGTSLSLIPYTHVTFKAMDYGVVIDAILLSFALAQKLKT